MNADQFTESLAGLLPQGYAWPRAAESVLMGVVRGKASEIAQLTADAHALVSQWQPHSTMARLSEWESSCGLPDACLGSSQTEAQRRAALLRTLRGPVLPLSDSSATAPTVIEAVCAEVGFDATVRYNKPFRVGREHIGERLGLLNGKLYVTVTSHHEAVQADLLCYLQRSVPARFSINIIFE